MPPSAPVLLVDANFLFIPAHSRNHAGKNATPTDSSTTIAEWWNQGLPSIDGQEFPQAFCSVQVMPK